MAQFAISFWLWLPAVAKATIYAIVAMGGAFIAGTDDVTAEEFAKWTRFEWARLCVGMIIAGGTPIIAFLDQSIQFVRSKISDTQLFTREGPR